jgi:hypothetical protein
VTAVPLERSAWTAESVARHVVSTSWLALVLVGGAAGIFAVVGGDLVEAVLGGSYGDDVGTELGLLVATLSPWMIASIGVSVAFPLAFVSRRTRALPAIAVGVLVAQVPLAWAGARLFELDGLAIALAISTFLAFATLLSQLGALVETARGFLGAAFVVALAAMAAFGIAALVLEPVPAAVLGLAVYVVVFAAVRPRGLVESVRYLRALA